MHTNSVILPLSMIPEHIHEKGPKRKSSSSFLSRIFTIDWDRALLLSTLVALVSAVAYAFFYKLPPLIPFAIGIWGLVTMLIYVKSVNSRPSHTQMKSMQDKLDEATEKNNLLNKNLEAKNSGEGYYSALLVKIKDAESRLKKLQVEAKDVQDYIESSRSGSSSRPRR